MSKNKKNKQQKQKVVYYDDGSTISDMSAVNRKGQKPKTPPKPRATFKEKWKTYWSAVKMMFIPMCFVLIVLTVLFLLFRFAL